MSGIFQYETCGWPANHMDGQVDYNSDEQTTARGPDAARLEVLSGPRQILK